MRAYERFLRYVKVYTTSDPDSAAHPTTARQLDLGRMLAEELKALGLQDARLDEHGYVYATLPAAPGYEKAPGLGFIAPYGTLRPTLRAKMFPRSCTKTMTAAT